MTAPGDKRRMTKELNAPSLAAVKISSHKIAGNSTIASHTINAQK
jgi:hypothetical protein